MEYRYKPIRLGIITLIIIIIILQPLYVTKTWLQKLLAKPLECTKLSTTHNLVHHRMSLVFVTGLRIIGDNRQRGRGGDEGDR
jgi:hypothetical protein